MRQPTRELTTEQITFFEEQGYLALDDIGVADEIDELREMYDELFDGRVSHAAEDYLELVPVDSDTGASLLPQVMKPAKYAPELYDTLLFANVQAMAAQLLGPGARVDFEHAIRKPARVGPPTPWHQDAAYWDPRMIHDAVSVWVPLQPVDAENGCMQFVPGSHRLDVLPHKHIGDDPDTIALELADPSPELIADAVACPLPGGGATFHGGYTVHYTGPNTSAEPRRALILDVQGAKARPREEPLTFTW
jgi:hypothetical protein